MLYRILYKSARTIKWHTSLDIKTLFRTPVIENLPVFRDLFYVDETEGDHQNDADNTARRLLDQNTIASRDLGYTPYGHESHKVQQDH